MGKKMKLGVRAHDYGKHTPTELANILKKEGFQAAQLAIMKAIAGVDDFLAVPEICFEEIQEAFTKNDIEISVLGCYIDPALLDQKDRLAQVAIFEKYLEYSLKVGAKLVGTETSGFAYEEADRKKVYEFLTDSVLRMVDKAEKIGAVVGIEPVASHTLNTPELTFELIQRVNSDHLKIVFDPINLITLNNVKEQEKLWKNCFDAFGKDISVLHLKDFVIKENMMVPTLLGEGLFEYEYLFQWLRKNKPELSILREEINPVTALQDIEFMKKIIV